MNQRRVVGILLLALGGAWGCEAFKDPTPENIFVQMSGTGGTEVQVIYTKEFVAGVSELTGHTEVRFFRADTVLQTLPVDTVINVSIERQLFIEVLPAEASDTLDVDVVVDVDDRNLVRNSGKIYPEDPWRFLYVFNRRFTSFIDVVV